MALKEEFKDRLKRALDYRNLKAADLCERGNIPKSTLSYYLSGRTEPKSDRLFIIAKALDVSEAWLLGYDVPMEKSASQQEIDALAVLNMRLKRDIEFKEVIFQINNLNSKQFEAVKNLLTAFPQ